VVTAPYEKRQEDNNKDEDEKITVVGISIEPERLH
jgi:hypothetical protein